MVQRLLHQQGVEWRGAGCDAPVQCEPLNSQWGYTSYENQCSVKTSSQPGLEGSMTLEVLLERKDGEIKQKMTIYPIGGLLSEPEFWETISELHIPRNH